MIHFYGCDFKSLKRNETLSRRRRYLTFPDGSLAVVSLFLQPQSYEQIYATDDVEVRKVNKGR
jgi:hypothetical protein